MRAPIEKHQMQILEQPNCEEFQRFLKSVLLYLAIFIQACSDISITNKAEVYIFLEYAVIFSYLKFFDRQFKVNINKYKTFKAVFCHQQHYISLMATKGKILGIEGSIPGLNHNKYLFYQANYIHTSKLDGSRGLQKNRLGELTCTINLMFVYLF